MSEDNKEDIPNIDKLLEKVSLSDSNKKSISRYDIATIDEILESEDGFLTVKVAVTRPGVFPYRKADGSVQHELKHPEDIYSSLTMNSIRAKPITDGHPNVPVTRNNIKNLIKGMSHTDVNVEDGLITVHETVFDEQLMQDVLSGNKREVSIGFETELIPEKGTYNGQEYDFRQTNIRVNHIAHVEEGRAGSDVGVRGDGAYQLIQDNTDNNSKQDKEDFDNGGNYMEKITIDGSEMEVQPEVKEKVDKLLEQIKTLEDSKENLEDLKKQVKELDETKEKLDSLKGELETKNGEIDALKAQIEKEDKADESEEMYTKDQVDEMITERVNIYNTASKYIKDFDDTGKSNTDIKVEVIQTVDSDFKGDEKSEEYINARYDATIAIIEKHGFKAVGDKNLKNMDKKDSTDKFEELRNKRLNLKK